MEFSLKFSQFEMENHIPGSKIFHRELLTSTYIKNKEIIFQVFKQKVISATSLVSPYHIELFNTWHLWDNDYQVLEGKEHYTETAHTQLNFGSIVELKEQWVLTQPSPFWKSYSTNFSQLKSKFEKS